MLAVVAQKVRARLRCFFWQREGGSGQGFKILLYRHLREKLLQALAQQQLAVGVERDQPGIERAVVQAGETEAVLRIQSLVWKRAPRHDVTGHQQFTHGQPAHAAACVEGV